MTDHTTQEGACRALAHLLTTAVIFTDAYNAFVDGDRGMEPHLDGLLHDAANAALAFVEAHAAYDGGINNRLFDHGTN